MTGASVFAANEGVSISNSVFLPKAGLAFDTTPDHTVAATINCFYRSGFAELPIGATTVAVQRNGYSAAARVCIRTCSSIVTANDAPAGAL